jgi:hypothetical protein
LTSEQAQAVQHGEGPLLLLAGPGAGKTGTLTHRAAYLLAAVIGGPGWNSGEGTASVAVPPWSDGLALGEGIGGEQFGSSVALYGSTAVIGAPGYSSDSGAVYVWVGSRAGAWSRQATITGGVAGAKLGSSVALYGSTAVFAAPGYNSGTGAAYVYVNSSGWSQQAELTAVGGAAGDQFGSSAAL